MVVQKIRLAITFGSTGCNGTTAFSFSVEIGLTTDDVCKTINVLLQRRMVC